LSAAFNILCLAVWVTWSAPGRLCAQDAPPPPARPEAAKANSTNASPARPNAAAAGTAPAPGAPPASPNDPSITNPEARTNAVPDEIQVSFQAANVDLIVQWLAQTTGKSVVKHPRVQCQLTIVSSKRVTTREAIDLIYRGLALEGFTAVESSYAIVIVPDVQEPKMSPVLLDVWQ